MLRPACYPSTEKQPQSAGRGVRGGAAHDDRNSLLPDLRERACREFIEEQRRASLLRSHSLEPRHRVLPVGLPDNGKISLAEAIADALAVQFFVVRYDAIIGSLLGETARRLRRVFDYARTTPCVLFFDEIDAVGKERGDVNETGEIKRVVTSLPMQVDALWCDPAQRHSQWMVATPVRGVR